MHTCTYVARAHTHTQYDTHTLSLSHTHTNKVLTTLSHTISSTYQHDKGAHLDKDGEEGTEALDKAYRYTLYGCHLCVCVCVCVLYGTHTHTYSVLMYVCVCVRMYVYMYVCMYVCMHMRH